MGLIVSIFKDKRLGDCSNGGLSSRYDELTLVNVSGPFEPTEDRPAAMLVDGNGTGTAKVVPVDALPPGREFDYEPMRGSMMGGCYVATSDSRFSQAVQEIVGGPFYGAVPLHDRFESAEYARSMD